MTTLKQFVAVRLVAELGLSLQEAAEIVAAEAQEWRIAAIPLSWDADITKCSRMSKLTAWNAVQARYQEAKKP